MQDLTTREARSTIYAPVITRTLRSGRQAGKTLTIGVAERTSIPAGYTSIAPYVALNGAVVSSTCQVVEVDEVQRALHAIPLQCPAFLAVGDDRYLVLEDEYTALTAELERVWAFPFGQAILAARAAKRTRQEQEEAARRERARTRSVRVLHLHGPYQTQTELTWGYLTTDEERQARHIVVPGWVVISGLPEHAPVPLQRRWLPASLVERVIARPALGWTWGEGRAWEISEEEWEELLAAQQARAETERVAEERGREGEQARVEAAFARARETGEPQVLASWVGDDDDPSIPDNSHSVFTELALPDGTTRTRKTPAY